MGFQFVHIESYARKADSKGRSVDFILDEVSRKPGASEHVKSPGEPTVVYGIGPEELRALHDRRVMEASTTNSTGKTKKLRVDQHTMMTVVASHPADEMSADVEKWQFKTVEWLKEKYGDKLQSVVRHDDEAHPHLHAYVLPDDHEMKARRLHDGVTAKDAAKTKALADGHDAKTANKLGDDAYKAAMRSLQDDYFERVGLSSGLARLGPGRRRLDRGAWKAEQAQVQHAAVAIAAAEKAQVEAARFTGVRQAEENMAAVLVEKAKRDVEAARRAAERAKAEADAAVTRKTEAEKAARGYVGKAKRTASKILADAEARAAKVATWGDRLGRMWTAFAGVRRRVESQAEIRIAEQAAQAKAEVEAAQAEVVTVKRQAISKVKTADDRAVAKAEKAVEAELSAARRAVEIAKQKVAGVDQKVGAAEIRALQAEAKLSGEISARRAAEAEKERFRGLWADADNRLIDLKRGRSYGR